MYYMRTYTYVCTYMYGVWNSTDEARATCCQNNRYGSLDNARFLLRIINLINLCRQNIKVESGATRLKTIRLTNLRTFGWY